MHYEEEGMLQWARQKGILFLIRLYQTQLSIFLGTLLPFFPFLLFLCLLVDPTFWNHEGRLAFLEESSVNAILSILVGTIQFQK